MARVMMMLMDDDADDIDPARHVRIPENHFKLLHDTALNLVQVSTDSTTAPPPKPAILFNERFMAAGYKEGYCRKHTIHIFSCVQRSSDR